MATYSLTTASNIFKRTYGPLSENTYNSYNVLLGRTKKNYNFVGDNKYLGQPLSFSGGVGSGSLPTANVADYGQIQIAAEKVYGVAEYDREAIKASSSSEGAFVEGIKEVTKKCVESYMRNMSRILFNDGTGALGTIDTGGVSGAGPWVCIISAATFKEANWEENDYVNVAAGSALFEITSVVPSTRAITLAAVSGSQTPAQGEVIYMQGSKDNDPLGLKGVCDATSGTLYNITVQRRWQSHQKAAASAGLTTDLMNECMLEVQRKSGKVPNLIITSFKQFRKLLNLLEDQKQYVIEPRSKDLQGKVSFKGVEFMSAAGAVGVFPERFCDDDRMYFLNDSYIETHHRPDFGWFDDDGTVFLRKASSDAYEARYGGYLQNVIIPTFQGVMTGLA